MSVVVVYNFRDRLTVSECLEHKWLQDNQTIIRTITVSSHITEKSLSDENHQCHHDVLSSDESACNSLSNSTVSDTSSSSSSFSVTPDKELDERAGGGNSVENSQQLNDAITTSNDLLFSSVRNSDSDLIMNGDESSDEDKENILVTNYINNARELNLAIGEKSTAIEKKNICEKLLPSNCTITNTTVIKLFPDAPTTPKVCRKAPDSPTSVKALVKKFQLESSTIGQIQQNDDNKIMIKSAVDIIVGGDVMMHHHDGKGMVTTNENGGNVDDDGDDDHPYCNGSSTIKPSQHKNHVRYFPHQQR